MPTSFSIPRQSDHEIISALGRVQSSLASLIETTVTVNLPKGNSISVPAGNPDSVEPLKRLFALGSTAIEYFYLRGPHGSAIAEIHRKFASASDSVAIQDDWINNFVEVRRPELWVAALSHLRVELRASDLEAAFKGLEDSAWNRYREAQATVVNSLQQTLEALLIKGAEKNAQLEKEREERFGKLEEKLRAEVAEERAKLEKQIGDQRANLGQREKALAARESEFETKEARYVARQKQAEQIKQIQGWLDGWHLTKGTREKRTPIAVAYVTALVITAGLTIWATKHNYSVLKTATDLMTLQWWHWLGIIAKSFFPLAAFTTFLIYFLRWSGDWARQHADEEFRHRTRLIDIGRSSWLLEAVRDAQERDKELPPDLLKELSRNLFADKAPSDVDGQPQAVADILLQGLSSLRVKSPDGGEVEAKRGK